MKQFYETYNGNEKLAPLVRELSWTHHRLVLPCKTEEEREFYLRMAIKERWSSRELERQLNSGYFERDLCFFSVVLRPGGRFFFDFSEAMLSSNKKLFKNGTATSI